MHKLSKNLVLIYTGKQKRTAKHIAKNVSKLKIKRENVRYFKIKSIQQKNT